MNSTHLENIAKVFFPEELKNKKFLNDIINIFCEVTNYYNPYPLIFNENQKVLDREVVNNSYINELYNTIKDAMQDSRVARKMRQLGGNNGSTTIKDIKDILNDEYLWISRIQKTTKGIGKNISQSYNTITATEIQTSIKDTLSITEVRPFKLQIKGGLAGELYDVTVKPLAHPLGFDVDYYMEIKVVNTDTVYGIDKFKLSFSTDLVWTEALDNLILDKFDSNISNTRNYDKSEMLDSLLDEEFLISTSSASYREPNLILDDTISQRHIIEF